MTQLREDPKPFDMEKLNEIRKLRASMYCGRDNWLFWKELEAILEDNGSETKEWTKLEKDDVVLGDVWTQPIGVFYYKNTVHTYSYLYVETPEGLVIDEHGHSELVHDGRDVKKTKEWYIFPDGRMEMCGKDDTHKLRNNFRKPIYVISLKITNRSKA